MPVTNNPLEPGYEEFKKKVQDMVKASTVSPVDDIVTMMNNVTTFIKAAAKPISLGLVFYQTYQEDDTDSIPPKVSKRLEKIVELANIGEALTEVQCMQLAAHCAKVIEYGTVDLANRMLPLMGRDLVAILVSLGILTI